MNDILCIRLSAIGDVLLTTPFLEAVKVRFPEARIFFVTGPDTATLLQHHPFIHRVLVYDKKNPNLNWPDLPRKFDLIADLQQNRHSVRIRQKFKGIVKILHKQNIRKWFMVNAPWHTEPCSHVVSRYLETLNISAEETRKYPMYLPVPVSAEDVRAILPETLKIAPYVAVSAGSAHFTKSIPPELLEKILPRLPFPALLLGTENEGRRFETLLSRFPGKLFSLCGKTDLLYTAAIVRESAFVITGDTAIMHLAACYQKKMHVIWGSTVPEFGMGPWVPESTLVQYHELKNLACRPCSKLGFSACPKKHFKCMLENPALHADFI